MEAAREHCCDELMEEGELLCGVPTWLSLAAMNVVCYLSLHACVQQSLQQIIMEIFDFILQKLPDYYNKWSNLTSATL
jgi:hypothetical protein